MNYEMTSLVMIIDEATNKTLLINNQNRPWKGYAPPGGHLDPMESLTKCAIREVWEETGLTVESLHYKGLIHWEDAKSGDRYMVFCYLTTDFTGTLSSGTHEGVPEWVDLDKLNEIGVPDGFLKYHARVFLSEGVHEFHLIWHNDYDGNIENFYEI